MRRIKYIALALTTLIIVSIPVSTFASDPCTQSSADLKTNASCGIQQTGGGGVDITNVFSSVVNILSLVVGAVAIIMIVVSGLRYITSNGDSAQVSSAKSTLIYALIGLAVAALAQFLVHFVLFHFGNK